MPFSASLRWLAPCLLSIGLAACSSPPQRAADGQDPRFQPASASDMLAQTSWDLARWTLPGGALRQIPHPSSNSRPLTASFVHDRGSPRISGFSGCNQYNGSYTVANGLLIVQGRPVSTMMACAPQNMKLEQDFLAALTSITASSVDSANNPQRMTWVLSSATGWTLAAAPIPSPAVSKGPPNWST